jgi:uncharacterized protein YvpB
LNKKLPNPGQFFVMIMRRMHKRTWSIILAVLFIGGLLPSIQITGTAHLPGPAPMGTAVAAWQGVLPLTPTLEPTKTVTLTVTVTPLQPLPPTPTASQTPVPTQTAEPPLPPPPPLPEKAKVKDIYGYGQLMPLSCESRSAADWARHFEIEIHEMDFFKSLPKSNNPEEGFVGSVYGAWGQTPPGPYGVHAGPVARLLRAYGARAVDVRDMTFTDLKQEIAAGKPVLVWVTGHVTPGKGIPYEVDGQTVTVAPYEHTVIVTAYDENKDQVTILDGHQTYSRSFDIFFQSWGALNNMAVIWEDD